MTTDQRGDSVEASGRFRDSTLRGSMGSPPDFRLLSEWWTELSHKPKALLESIFIQYVYLLNTFMILT
jgi:hypothetical protein